MGELAGDFFDCDILDDDEVLPDDEVELDDDDDDDDEDEDADDDATDGDRKKKKGCKKAHFRKIFNQFMSADEETLDFINFVEAARAVNCKLDAEDDDDDEDADDDVVG